MSRILKVVNLSNWDGEDYEVVTQTSSGAICQETLKPGEEVSIMDAHLKGAVLFRPTESKEPELFKDDEGKQMVPKMDLRIGYPY